LQKLANGHPLVQGQAVNHDQRGAAATGVLDIPGQAARHMVQHGWIGRRQVDQTGVVIHQPTGEGRVQCIADFPEPGLILGAVAAVNQRRKFGPFQCKGGPVRVTRFRSGQFLFDKVKQAGNPKCVIVRAGGGDAASNPRPGIHFNICGLDWGEFPLQEQVVDVDLDVLMVERQAVRAGILEAVFRRIFPHQPGKKERPAFLQKGEEGLIVRNDLGKRPGFEPIMAFQNLDEPLGQHQRDLELAVVQTEQGAKQLHLVGDQLRRNAEHMAENEILGGVVAHAIRRRFALGIE